MIQTDSNHHHNFVIPSFRRYLYTVYTTMMGRSCQRTRLQYKLTKTDTYCICARESTSTKHSANATRFFCLRVFGSCCLCSWSACCRIFAEVRARMHLTRTLPHKIQTLTPHLSLFVNFSQYLGFSRTASPPTPTPLCPSRLQRSRQ